MERYRTPELWRWWLRGELNHAFQDLPQGTGLQEIFVILEELMFEEWGMQEPTKVVLKPHPSEEWLAERCNESDCEEEDAA